MSIELLNWAIGQDIPHSSCKFILVMLGNMANPETGYAFPSVQYLEERTGLNRKTIIACLGMLRDRGYIEDTGKRTGDTKQIVVYKLHDKESLNWNSTKNGTVPKMDENSAVFSCEQSRFFHETVPKTGHVTQRETKVTQEEPQEGFLDGRKRKLQTIDQWLTSLPKGDQVRPFSDNDPLFANAKKIGIPEDYLRLCWRRFKRKHQETGKKYKDWRKTFRNCVLDNWYGLWWFDGDGVCKLTTAGKQEEKLNE